jgi:branched-chain amino acid transport system substrate-binding protein
MQNVNLKKILALVMALAMMVSIFAGCSSSSSTSSSTATEETTDAAETTDSTEETAEEATEATAGTLKIGGIGPLTGAAAIYGNAHKNGAEIAVEEINALGGIQIELNFQDDEHDAEKSVNAYNNLKDWGMQILCGTTTTTPCVAVSAESNADRIFTLTPSASSTDVLGGFEDENGNTTIARKDNTFQLCFTDPNQGTASAQYIYDQQLGTNIAVIYNNGDAYSTGIYTKFASEAEALGLNVVSVTTFTDDSATDFSVQLNAAKDAGADLIFLPIYYTPASLIITQAAAMEYDVTYFGVDGMDGILSLEGFDTSLAEGVMLLTPFSADATDERTVAFVTKYEETYGEVPNQFAADGYDCIWALYNAFLESGLSTDASAEEICEALIGIFTSDSFSYDGITGEGMTWSTTGEVSKDPKGMVIQDGAYVGM